jgi:hypothetical protein
MAAFMVGPLYHRSVRMYSLRSETNRRSGSVARVRAASIPTGLFGEPLSQHNPANCCEGEQGRQSKDPAGRRL